MTITATAKVRRLLAEQRVMPAGPATAYRVRGDHATYIVAISDTFDSCTCPAHGDCSHRQATRILHAALSDAGVAGHELDVAA